MPISYADYLIMKHRLDKGKTLCEVFSHEPESREGKLHDRILEECRRRKWLVVHSRMDARTTTAQGVPDFIILAHRSRVFFFECKSPKGKLTPEQLGFALMAEELGHKVHVVRSFSEFLNLTA